MLVFFKCFACAFIFLICSLLITSIVILCMSISWRFLIVLILFTLAYLLKKIAMCQLQKVWILDAFKYFRWPLYVWTYVIFIHVCYYYVFLVDYFVAIKHPFWHPGVFTLNSISSKCSVIESSCNHLTIFFNNYTINNSLFLFSSSLSLVNNE